MALAMTRRFPVLFFRALGLDSTRHYHHHYHPSPTRVFKNSLTCTRGGLNNSSSQLPAYDIIYRSRRGFKLLCKAINYGDKEVDHVHETKEAVENVHDGFVGKPIVIRSRATIPPTYPRGSSLLMLTDKENLIGNPEDNRESRELGDPRLRFLLEESRKFKGLVHIKSCYNNRYWVRKQSTETGFLDTIAAESEKPEEDQSKPSCTLFKPVYAGNEGHVCELRCLGSENGALFLTLDRGQLSLSKSPTLLFEIVEWDKMVIFPKYVTFKDANGYLSAGNTQGLPHLQFASQDITDPTIGNEVFVNENGTIRIKSTHLGKFWKRSPNGILCDAEEKDSFQPDCLFRPVKLGDNTVALCNLGNNQFCKGLTTKGKKNCLNAADLDITKEAHLVVEELVSSRTIYNVEYHVEAAKVDIDRKVIMANYTLENLTPETNWKTVKLGYNDSKTNTWNAPVSLKVSGEMTFKVGVPFIASSEVKISLEVTRSYEWGDSSTPSKYVEVSSTVAVPPMSKRKVMVVASKGKCHIPFSYYQRDLLVNGQYVTVKKHDGLYTGVNYFNFSSKIVVA